MNKITTGVTDADLLLKDVASTAPKIWLSAEQVEGAETIKVQYLPFRLAPEGKFDLPVALPATDKAIPRHVSTSGWLQTVPPPAPTKLQWDDDSQVVDAEFPGMPTIAECIAQLDVWNGHLEAAIDRQAHEKLGQHANDELAAGGRDPMEQLP